MSRPTFITSETEANILTAYEKTHNLGFVSYALKISTNKVKDILKRHNVDCSPQTARNRVRSMGLVVNTLKGDINELNAQDK